MLRIGDFARLAGVTVRALRHYADQGLLLPAQVDEETGYRRYRYDQLAALDRVLALRDLGFSLAETRELLGAGPAAIEARLLGQRRRLVAELQRQSARLLRLETLLRALAADPRAPELGVRVRPIRSVRALTLRAERESVTALFEEAEARAARDRVDESPFALFHGAREVEVCVPVRADCKLAAVREVPGAALAGSLIWSGSYTKAKELLPRLQSWLRRNGLRRAGPPREVYHRFGAGQRGYRLPQERLAASADQYVTELQLPAEESR
jgi:DNA-binding transcriptional MerR regulator